MSGVELQVIPEDLEGKASQLRGLSLAPAATQPALIAPDALDTTGVAIANLAMNAKAMWAYQEFGRLEGLRLAQTLDNVAAAYAQVDKASGNAIAGTVGGPGSPGPPDPGSHPDSLDLPTPPHPARMPTPRGKLVSEQLLFPPETQRALEAGDGGASLDAAAQMWRSNAQLLATAAAQFDTNALRWEGEAADTAYAKFTAYRDWLVSFAGSWQQLAGEAGRIVDAHSAAKRDNEPIAEQFEKLQTEIAQDPASADNLRKTVQMAALQSQSEAIRNRYARDGHPYQVQPADPPSPVVAGMAVTVDDHLRTRRAAQGERRNQGSGGPAGAGGPPAQVAPQTSPEQAAHGPQQTGPVGAESPGAGQPGASPATGPGHAPSGGQPGAAMPMSPPPPTAKSTPPTEPSLRPAASGARGAGPAGGAGSGTPPALQPAVGAETVAPAPIVAPTAAAAPAAPGGAAGTGGVAPMMHGAKGDGSGDRKRNPLLSGDEELYTEDRAWTEAIIGNRVRRRGTAEDTKKEST